MPSLPIFLVKRACPIARSHHSGRHRLTATHEATLEIAPFEA
jgi:hypothetical protein